jgi:DNA-binding winged helix-turn-helix (wHTH) protein/tetratricopeptide (TPR) repeat protein
MVRQIESVRARPFKVGEWVVRPALNQIENGHGPVTLEPKAMDLLVALAGRAGDVVTQSELREQVWAGTAVAENAVFRLVSELRQHLEDSPRAPRYIQTIPKRGYRLVAEVSEVRGPWRRRAAAAAMVAAGLLGAALWWRTGTSGSDPVQVAPTRPESYAIGEVLEDRVDCSSYDRARIAFEETMRTRPEYSPTYGHLADSYLAAAVLGCIPPGPAEARVDDLVARIDAWGSEADRLRHQAAAQFWLHWDFARAGDLFRRVEAVPDVSRAAYLLKLDRPGEAASEVERAWKVDPAQIGESWSLATTRLLLGDYADATERYRQLLTVYPGYPPALALSALSSWLDGRPDDALRVARQAAIAENGPADRFSPVPALVLAKLGRPSEAQALLDRWDAWADAAAWVAPTAAATAALARGRTDDALRALEYGVRLRDPWLVLVAVDPTFAELRGDARFDRLMRR